MLVASVAIAQGVNWTKVGGRILHLRPTAKRACAGALLLFAVGIVVASGPTLR